MTHNIALKVPAEQLSLERDLKASAMIYKVRHGMMARSDVTAELNKISDIDEYNDMRKRVNKYQRVKVAA